MEIKPIFFYKNVKQGKEGEVKGKGIAGKSPIFGNTIGEGETPCFALGFVVSPSHIGSPFAGVAQIYRGHLGSVACRKLDNYALYLRLSADFCLTAGSLWGYRFVGFHCLCVTECEKCVAFFCSYWEISSLLLLFWWF